MPYALRARGIFTQPQLIMALLPYMEWVPVKEIYQKVRRVFPNQRSHHPAKCNIYKLRSQGYLETMLMGEPPAAKNGSRYRLKPPMYVRRISKKMPPCPHSKMTGMHGSAITKKRAEKARDANKKKAPPKHTVKTLTANDIDYIRDNPHDVSIRALAEMFNQGYKTIEKIRDGHVPDHLKAPPAR